MAKVSICDYCKKVVRGDFEVELILNYIDSHTFEICKGCFESLKSVLEDVAYEATTAIISTNANVKDEKIAHWNFISNVEEKTEALLEHEAVRVPSRRDEVVRDTNECKHKYDMMQTSTGDMFMACVKCNEKMKTESIS